MFHRAKKSLGQNFLKSGAALAAMVDVTDIHAEDVVLEIGPGKGALTEKLAALAGKVIAVEKDPALVALLQERFAADVDAGRLDVVLGDALEFDPTLLRAYGTAYKLVANIPYYITGAIIRKFLETAHQPSEMALLVQKEVAERIVSRDGKESLLSLSVKAYGIPSYVMKVPARYFSPAPKVDSAIVHIRDISRGRFASPADEAAFFALIHAGFAHKRKMLLKNLADAGYGAAALREAFALLAVPEKARAEDVHIDTWCALAKLATLDA